MLRLMDECRRHPLASLLMRTEGRYAGSYAFPFCHIAVLSHINRSQIEREAPELSRLFPPKQAFIGRPTKGLLRFLNGASFCAKTGKATFRNDA